MLKLFGWACRCVFAYAAAIWFGVLLLFQGDEGLPEEPITNFAVSEYGDMINIGSYVAERRSDLNEPKALCPEC